MSEGLDLLYWRILEKWDKLKTWLEMWLKRSANIRFTTLAIRAVELWAKHSDLIPTVVPLVEVQVTNIVSHKPTIHGGNHVSLHIQEQGEEVISRRMAHANVWVSKFNDSISSELDKIVGEAGGGGDVIHMLSDDNSSWMEFQFDEENEIAGHIPDIRLGEQNIELLRNYVVQPCGVALGNLSVADMVTNSGEWNWGLFQHLLLMHVLLHIAAILPLLE
ncbi:hypothetical protein V6N13_114137 [Hibiscus sabdariffa]